MKYDFDKVTDRKNTNSLKYDFAVERGKPANVLPLWVADMDFPVADEITEKLSEVVAHGIYGYSEAKDSYFEVLREWMERYHGYSVKKEWLVKTPGVVFALALAIRAFSEAGDGVMIQNPVYYPFREVIEDNDRKVVDNTLVLEDGRYIMDLEDFERRITQENVKIFILCNPHNPVGRVWTRQELSEIARICLKYHVIVLSDEIHHDFVYEGYQHTTFATVDERLNDITVTCTAPSKTFNLAGLQVSNIFVANEELRRKFKKELDRTGYSQLNTAGLAACEAAYGKGRPWLEQLLAYLKGNLDFAREYISEKIPQIRLIEPEGTYLIWLDFRGLSLDNTQLEDLIVNKAGLWLDAGAIFGPSGEGFERINIACPRSVLKEALERIEKAVKG